MPALVVALPRSREGSARDSLSSLESVPPQLDTPSADAEANAELSGIIMRRKQSMAVNLQKKQSVFEVERSGGEAGRSGGEAAAVTEEEPESEVVTFGNTPSPAKAPLAKWIPDHDDDDDDDELSKPKTDKFGIVRGLSSLASIKDRADGVDVNREPDALCFGPAIGNACLGLSCLACLTVFAAIIIVYLLYIEDFSEACRWYYCSDPQASPPPPLPGASPDAPPPASPRLS